MAVLLMMTVLVLSVNCPGPTNAVFAEVPTLHLLALVPMTPGPSPQPSYNRGEGVDFSSTTGSGEDKHER